MKYFDSVNSKSHKQFFCNYNETMFAQVSVFSSIKILQLMYFMSIKTLSKGEFLYTDSDLSTKTYFMFQGKIEIIVKSKGTDEFKFSK